ncbi:MAG: DUF2842 domain-containing protein [Rhizobiales bacterium]|nr:DUF2842 domain-containing protein [Hyphomicrobiales bacterium]MBL6770591.1 DUF2842 domain-containing protein [Hyphomicrobiales bacterium]
MKTIQKLSFTILLLIYLFIYILISMRIGVFILRQDILFIEIIYFIVIGILWTIPIIFIIRKKGSI